jgi:tRNA(adenine34) deaminase
MTDEHYMRRCLELARGALAAGEVPVGAVVVDGDRIVGEGAESVVGQCDPAAHAEVTAIREACRLTRSLSLSGMTIYSTIEPCVLCAYVVRATDVGRVVFGIPAGRLGGSTSSYPLLLASGWPGPPPPITRGVLASECAELMQAFVDRRAARGGPRSRG